MTEKRKIFSLALTDDRVEQCLSGLLVGLNSKCGVQSKRKHESVCTAGFSAFSLLQKKSVVYETECIDM